MRWFVVGFLLVAQTALAEPPALRTQIDQLLAKSHPGPLPGRCSDLTFLRRVSLKLTGTIPARAQIDTFLADKSPAKRSRLVDRMLSSPAFGKRLAEAFDIAWMERRAAKQVKAGQWRGYLERSFAADRSFAEIVAEIISNDGADAKNRAPAAFVLERGTEPNLLTREVGRMFFGKDFQCAQCHDHPNIDDYKQADYYGLYAFLNGTHTVAVKKKPTVLGERAPGDVAFKSVFTELSGNTKPRMPGGVEIEEPQFPPGQEYKIKPAKNVRPIPKFSRRAKLAELIRAGKNSAFNRNAVNRIWALVMGRGLVHPVDFHHSANPPSHPQLLDLLEREFSRGGHRVKPLIREIILSEAFQRTSRIPRDLSANVAAAKGRLSKSASHIAKLEKIADDRFAAFSKAEMAVAERDEQHAKLRAARIKQLASVAATRKTLDANKKKFAASKATMKRDEEIAALLAQSVMKLRQAKSPALAKAVAAIDSHRAKVANRADLAKKAAGMLTALEKKLADETAKLKPLSQQLRDFEAKTRELQAVAVRARVESDAAYTLVTAAKRRATMLKTVVEFGDAKETLRVARADLQVASRMMGSIPGPKQISEIARLAARIEKLKAVAGSLEDRIIEHWTEQFALAVVSHLSPEQLARSVLEASGEVARQRKAAGAAINKKTPLSPADRKDSKKVAARELQIDSTAWTKLNSSVAAVVRLFAAGSGQPQDGFFATIEQALFFANGSQIRSWMAISGNLVDRCVKQIKDDEQIVRELYLSILVRLPDAQELAEAKRHLAVDIKSRTAAVSELAWALITSAEFRFHH